MDWSELVQIATGYKLPAFSELLYTATGYHLTGVPEIFPLHPFIGSITYFAIMFITGAIMRRVSQAVFSPRFHSYVADFVCTLQTCACSLENSSMMEHYGPVGFFLTVFFCLMFFIVAYDDHSPSPLSNFYEYVRGKRSIKDTLLRISIQAGAGLLAFRFAKSVWSLGLHDYHRHRFEQTHCVSDLMVPVVWGFLVEGGATLLNGWVWLQTLTRYPWIDNAVKSVFCAGLVLSGLHLTGMYLHPAMASCHTLTCPGTTIFEHLFVYWIGPFLGIWGSIELDNLVHVDLTATRKSQAQLMPTHYQYVKKENNFAASAQSKTQQKKRFYTGRSKKNGVKINNNNNNFK